MYIYAGIDEAGYGPMFGPLLVGRAVFALDGLPADAAPPMMWKLLASAVCRDVAQTKKRGRIAVNDSKKLHTPGSAGGATQHLERGVLAFAAAAGQSIADVRQWLDALGETCHHDLVALPWYMPTDERPWAALPRCWSATEMGIDRNMLIGALARQHIRVLDMGAAVVLEDRFNQMTAATRSKAAVNFTFVASHLRHIWDRYGTDEPTVVVDHQSARVFYRELLQSSFTEAQITVVSESPRLSTYFLRGPAVPGAGTGARSMTVHFQVEAEAHHLPVALASMISKYTRELLMARFQAWFTHHAPHVKPTAGYAQDGQRFWKEIEPLLPTLDIDPSRLVRMA